METTYNLFSTDLVHALSWTLLHSLWQGLLIACLLSILIKWAYKLSAHQKYLFSLVALVVLFCSSLVTFLVYFDVSNSAGELSVFIAQDLNNVMGNVGLEDNQMYVGIASYVSAYSEPIVFAWLAGFVLFMGSMLLGIYKINKLKKHILPIASKWEDQLNGLANKLNFTGKIILGESYKINSPLTFGIFKPVILFPIGMINRLTPQEVEAIMAHELAHIVRKDYLINFVQTLLEGIYYFNPGAWIIASIIRRQREHCCDDMAIDLTGSSVHYLKALVAIEESNQETPALAMAFSRNKKPLLQRVQRILKQPQKNNNMKEKLMMSTLILLGLLLFTLDVNSKEKEAEENHTPEIFAFEQEENNPVSQEIQRDTLPESETAPLKYLDEGEKYLDVKEFEELIDDSDVKIIIKDGDIHEMEVDGRDLSEEEISKIQYNLSDDEMEDLEDNADIILFIDEDYKEDRQELRGEMRRELARKKADIIREKEAIKREIRSNASSLRRDKERIKREIRSEKSRIRKTIDNAKRDARIEIRRARSYSDEDLDSLFEELDDEIADAIAITIEDLNLDELHDLKIEISEDLEEELAYELEELDDDLEDLADELEDSMRELTEDLEEEYMSTESIILIIEDELLKDNLIDDKSKYSFLLKKNKFQVNGKGQSAQVRRKYKNLLKNLTDGEWSSNSKLKLVRKGNLKISEFSLKN